jgi:hypothetical protein
MSKRKIVVRGPAMSLSGYGEQCRFALRSLKNYTDIFDIYLTNIPWGHTGFIIEDTEERRWLDSILKKTIEHIHAGGSFDVSLQVTIPNEFEQLAPVNIGYTAGIETDKISPEWLEKTLMMDRIIVVSEHAKEGFLSTSYPAQNPHTGEMFEAKVQSPVTSVGYPVRKFEPDQATLESLDFEHDFNFLTMAQWGPRKNLENTIRWFIDEFKDDEIGLVVKTFQKCNSHIDKVYTLEKLQNLIGEDPERKCKIYFLHGSMTDTELAAVYAHEKIKAFVNLSHGEGFGLPMFEATTHSLPVVAPAWSGHCDFLYAPVVNKKTKKSKIRPLFARVDYTIANVQKEAVWPSVINEDAKWCFPSERDYKKTLRSVYKEYPKYKSMSKKLNKHITETFTDERQYKLFAEAVLGTEIRTVSKEELPKVSIITSVYDGDEYIRGFMEDITNQTVFDNCELIMIDAASPGNEEEVIREYMEKHDNILYKKLDEDPGIYGAWNEAIKLATGEYITNANLDDRKAPWSLERHASELYLNEHVDLVYADSFITNKPNETFDENSSDGRRYNFEQFSKEAMLRGNQPHNNPMWRRSLHDEHGSFSDNYKSAGDWEFFLRTAFAGAEFKKIDDVLGLYYFNPRGISTNMENFSWKQKEEREIYQTYKEMQDLCWPENNIIL